MLLQVLNDSKNWWECTNVHHRVGYVPHTILSVVNFDQNSSPQFLPPQDQSLHLASLFLKKIAFRISA